MVICYSIQGILGYAEIYWEIDLALIYNFYNLLRRSIEEHEIKLVIIGVNTATNLLPPQTLYQMPGRLN